MMPAKAELSWEFVLKLILILLFLVAALFILYQMIGPILFQKAGELFS